jgi:hypothetical protein
MQTDPRHAREFPETPRKYYRAGRGAELWWCRMVRRNVLRNVLIHIGMLAGSGGRFSRSLVFIL